MKTISHFINGNVKYRKGWFKMQQVYVKFNNVEQVRNFINIIDRIDTNFDLGTGNRVVDAKSVIGVFGLDLTRPQMLRYDSDDHRILEKISPFLVAAAE